MPRALFCANTIVTKKGFALFFIYSLMAFKRNTFAALFHVSHLLLPITFLRMSSKNTYFLTRIVRHANIHESCCHKWYLATQRNNNSSSPCLRTRFQSFCNSTLHRLSFTVSIKYGVRRSTFGQLRSSVVVTCPRWFPDFPRERREKNMYLRHVLLA